MSKEFEPTAEQRRNVQAMIGYGIKEADICRLIVNPETGRPIDEKTLRRHFEREIDTGQVVANVQVANSLFELATKSDNPSVRYSASAFFLSRRAGWKETSVQELVGKDGAAIEVNEVRERIAGRIAKIASAADDDVGFGEK
jgi:hypothetical protein